MSDDKERDEAYDKLLIALLGRVLDMLRFAEAKNAALLAFASTWIVGIVNLISSGKPFPRGYQYVALTALPLFIVAATIAIASLLPKLQTSVFTGDPKGHFQNLMFFGDIAKLTVDGFRNDVRATYRQTGDLPTDAYFSDLEAQISINSRITRRKHRMFNVGAIEMREATPGTGAFRGGAQTGVAYARFGQGFDSVSSYAQGADGGRYTVNAGDTLSGIALQLWGDASLWYKLAQANGLSADSALVEGQTLTVPAGVIRTANNASTMRPYDPSDAYGDTSPTTPKPIPPKVAPHKNKCGVFGAILLVVVAAAVTFSLPPLAPGLGPVLGPAVQAAAVSTISQGINLAVGIQDKFG